MRPLRGQEAGGRGKRATIRRDPSAGPLGKCQPSSSSLSLPPPARHSPRNPSPTPHGTPQLPVLLVEPLTREVAQDLRLTQPMHAQPIAASSARLIPSTRALRSAGVNPIIEKTRMEMEQFAGQNGFVFFGLSDPLRLTWGDFRDNLHLHDAGYGKLAAELLRCWDATRATGAVADTHVTAAEAGTPDSSGTSRATAVREAPAEPHAHAARLVASPPKAKRRAHSGGSAPNVWSSWDAPKASGSPALLPHLLPFPPALLPHLPRPSLPLCYPTSPPSPPAVDSS